MKLKYLADIFNGNSISDDKKDEYTGKEIPYIPTKELSVKDGSINYENGLSISEDDGFRIAPANSVLLCIEGGSAGKKIALTDRNVAFVNKLCCIHGNKVDSKLLYYCLKSKDFTDQFYLNMSGLITGVSVSILKNLFVTIPEDKGTQQKIVSTIESKTTKIDALIANEEKQIEKLKSYKQSLITETVTKGLPSTCHSELVSESANKKEMLKQVQHDGKPVSMKQVQHDGKSLNRKMKDSGVEWIGQIPAEWEVSKIRYLGSLQNGISKGGESFGEGYPFVSYGDVYKNIVLPKEVKGLIKSSEEERVTYSVQKGDVFFTRTSETIDEVGFSSVCEETIPNSTFAGFVIRMRPFSEKLTTEFAKYYFRGNHLRTYLVKEMNLVTRASLGQTLLKNMTVLIPSKLEQQSIAAFLDSKCSQIDKLISLKESKIEKLTAYKKSLIYEYVTGKKEA